MLLSPSESGRVSRTLSGIRFAKFENPANLNEGRVSHSPLLSDANSTCLVQDMFLNIEDVFNAGNLMKSIMKKHHFHFHWLV